MFSFSFTERLARFCAKHPWLTLGAWIIALAGAGYLATGIGDRLTTDQATAVELESDRAERLIEERMGGDEASAELLVIRAGNLTVDDHLAAVDEPVLVNAGQSLRREAGRIGFRTAEWRNKSGGRPVQSA